jgi:hypothetical protein
MAGYSHILNGKFDSKRVHARLRRHSYQSSEKFAPVFASSLPSRQSGVFPHQLFFLGCDDIPDEEICNTPVQFWNYFLPFK